MSGDAQALDDDWGWVEMIDASHPVTISPEEWRLVAACHGPTSPAQLAMRSGLTPDQVRAAVAALAARGLVRAEAVTSTRGASGHGSLFAPAGAPGRPPAAPTGLPATRTHVLPELGGAAVGPEPLVFDASDVAMPPGEVAPEGPLVFAPPTRDLGSRSTAPLPERAVSAASSTRSTKVGRTAAAPVVAEPAVTPPIAAEALVAEPGPPIVAPDPEPATPGPARKAPVPPPLSGAKASPFERRLAKLERRANLVGESEDADADVDTDGVDGEDDPGGAVGADGAPPRRRDSSSVVLRMVRSLGEASGRS